MTSFYEAEGGSSERGASALSAACMGPFAFLLALVTVENGWASLCSSQSSWEEKTRLNASAALTGS